MRSIQSGIKPPTAAVSSPVLARPYWADIYALIILYAPQHNTTHFAQDWRHRRHIIKVGRLHLLWARFNSIFFAWKANWDSSLILWPVSNAQFEFFLPCFGTFKQKSILFNANIKAKIFYWIGTRAWLAGMLYEWMEAVWLAPVWVWRPKVSLSLALVLDKKAIK